MENNDFNNYENNNFDNIGSSNKTEPQKPKSRLGLGILIGVLITFAVMIALAVAIAIIAGTTLRKGKTQISYDEKIDTIRSYLDQYYLGDLDEEKLEDGIAQGMLEGTGDKYAYYYSEEEFARLMEDVSGTYAGVGISIIKNDDEKIEVYKVFEGTPAEEAGVHVKDIIVEADGVRNFESVDDLVSIVRGPEGTSVDIVVLRDGKEIPITVERRIINIPTVTYKMLDNKIGYIEISEFDSITVEQFNNALDDLSSQGMTALILDVRDNPGGDYDTVVAMCDRVLPEGDIITVEDKNGAKRTEHSDDEHQLTLPMALLINENSASASEVFAGAIQDYDLATIVGKTSYGKGVVQSIYRMPDGSGMKFTTEKYLTPKGRDINGVGIIPEIEVEMPEDVYEDGVVDEDEDTQLKKAIEVLSQVF